MGVFDRFMNAIKINNDEFDEDDEFYDEDDDIEDEEDGIDVEDDLEDEKPKKGFFKRILNRDEKDEDYYDDDSEEEEPVSKKPSYNHSSEKTIKRGTTAPQTKVTPMRRHSGKGMEVHVIKPVNMEETREIADTLLTGCTVILNLEGLDVEVAQRVIDFSSGACYSINGSLQKVSSYIFILTPHNVEITGDITNVLSDSMSATMR